LAKVIEITGMLHAQRYPDRRHPGPQQIINIERKSREIVNRRQRQRNRNINNNNKH